MKQFLAAWDSRYSQSENKTVGIEFFIEEKGYDKESLIVINKLAIGHLFAVEPGHTVVRLEDKKDERETFHFYIDQKEMAWRRYKYAVQADTYEEAEKIIIAEFENPEYSDEIYMESESLDDSSQDISPAENGGEETRELFNDEYPRRPDPIMNNKPVKHEPVQSSTTA